MTWRIDEQVVRGQIDSRTQGRVTGHVWLVGRDEPLALDLEGLPHRDLAGHVLHFTNPQPVPGELAGLETNQAGVTGDVTAARKAKVPDCTAEELIERYAANEPISWRWRNFLRLEWHSRGNGRVIIESSRYQLRIDPVAAWTMTPAEEAELAATKAAAIARLTAEQNGFARPDASSPASPREPGEMNHEDDDAPQSAAEAAADAETARMDLLLDRIGTRLEREGYEDGKFEAIIVEESARLRRERGEPEPDADLRQDSERATRFDFINPVMTDRPPPCDADVWTDQADDDEPHPLLSRCSNLAIRLHEEAGQGGWLPVDASPEHPITQLVASVLNASGKLAGAFGMHCAEDESWPPPPPMAGASLVRLKKTRACLRDSLRALAAADQEHMACPAWRVAVRAEIGAVLAALGALIAEARAILADPAE